MNSIGKIFIIGQPRAIVEVIERADTRGITCSKAKNNGMKIVLF